MKKPLLSIFFIHVFSVVATAQWTEQNSGSLNNNQGIQDISIVNPQVIWAAGYDGSATGGTRQEFIRTINGGATWLPVTITHTDASGKDFANVSAVSATTAFFGMFDPANGGGALFKTTDGGVTVTKQALPVTLEWLNFTHFFDATNGVLMSDPPTATGDFQILVTGDGGASWTQIPGAAIPNVTGGDFGLTNGFSARGNNIWFFTTLGFVYRSSDKGLTWAKSNTGMGGSTGTSNINLIEFKDANNGLVTFGSLVKSTSDGGATWTTITPTGPIHSTDIAYIPGTANTYISSGGNPMVDEGTSFSTDGGLTWTAIDAVQRTAIEFYDNMNGWVGGFAGMAGLGGISKYAGAPFTVLGRSKDQIMADVTIYPNPTAGRLHVELLASGNWAFTVLTLTGKIVYRQPINPAVRHFDVSELAAGSYLVHVITDKGTFTQPLIIRK